MKKVLFLLLAALLHLQTYATLSYLEPIKNNYIAEWGRLKLVGNQLCDENGNAIQLTGWSTSEVQIDEGCNSLEHLIQMKKWDANIIRLAVHVTE